jgi:hypothetical protein
MQEPSTAVRNEAADNLPEEADVVVLALAGQVDALLRQLREVLPEERHREMSDRIERLQRPGARATARRWKEEMNWLDEMLAMLVGLASGQADQSRP